MKATLKKVTEEMLNEELVKTLNDNFEALNNKAEERENLILGRLTSMQKEITSFKKELKSSMDALLNHFQIPNGKHLLTDSKKKAGK